MGRFGAVHNGALCGRGYFAQKPKTVIKGRFDLDYLPKKMREKGIIMPWEAGTHCR